MFALEASASRLQTSALERLDRAAILRRMVAGVPPITALPRTPSPQATLASRFTPAATLQSMLQVLPVQGSEVVELRAVGGDPLRNGQADTATGAGDEHRLAV